MGLEPGVMEDKTKPKEIEKRISDGKKASDFDRRTPPEQGEGPTSAGVVTGPKLLTRSLSFRLRALRYKRYPYQIQQYKWYPYQIPLLSSDIYSLNT